MSRSHRDWEVRSRRRVFAGGPILEVAVEHVILPDGRELPDYNQIQMADFALVFATTEDGVIVLQQYKHGPRRMCLTFPGGAVEDSEQPLAPARRELLEETGYVSDHWSTYGRYVTNTNQYCTAAYLWRADRCRRVSAPTAPDVEQPELLVRPVSELLRPESLQQFGSVGHLALLTIASHPDSVAAPAS
jgi:ADP-ribose pyrophosphatase